MKIVVQRVNSASVSVKNKLISEINKGILVFVGIHKNDTDKNIDFIIKKILELRIFPGDGKPINKSILDLNLEILCVSQFTLYGDCSKGNRPSFFDAMPPEKANLFYENFINKFKKEYTKVKDGIFGANMQVSLINDGPVTIILER
jgi:D-tyrosyl-tRNA(Tyr) deacylase